MSYKNIIAASVAKLEAQKELEALETARLAAEQAQALAAYQIEAIRIAERIIHPDLVEFLTVTTDKTHWGYGFSLNIPECNPILFQLQADGKLNGKFTTKNTPELITSEDDEESWIYDTGWEDSKDLEIAIAHAHKNFKLELEYTQTIEYDRAQAAKASQARMEVPADRPRADADVYEALDRQDYMAVIELCRWKYTS